MTSPFIAGQRVSMATMLEHAWGWDSDTVELVTARWLDMSNWAWGPDQACLYRLLRLEGLLRIAEPWSSGVLEVQNPGLLEVEIQRMRDDRVRGVPWWSS